MGDHPVYYINKKVNYIEGIQGLCPIEDIPFQHSILGPPVDIAQSYIAGHNFTALEAQPARVDSQATQTNEQQCNGNVGKEGKRC